MTLIPFLAPSALVAAAIAPTLGMHPPLTAQFLAASPWAPVAHIHPKQPYTVHLNNQTGIVLEYSSTTNEFSPRRLQPGSTATLTTLPLPIYLLISPVNSRLNLKYQVSVHQNTVNITVTQLPNSVPGNTTINIQETGGIFVY